ncbi:MAG: RNA polymerase subunit sigma-70 [Chloroflexi bacterium RBG_16_50_11]|nr:MAG: RNA polymerase subunit sigma-70 [Chloroflexi bacterium RBG_16_50_11]
MRDEESLIRRAQQRDQVALTQLYENNFDRIYRYIVFKIGDRTEAEDMTQQVFLNAIQSIASYKFKGMPFTSWLYRIAHNQVVDHLRKKTRRPTAPLDETIPAGEEDPGHAAERKLEIEAVVLAAKKLTAAQQEVISLRFGSELSVAEVAKAIGKSEGAVKALQHSAIVALRKALVKGGAA